MSDRKNSDQWKGKYWGSGGVAKDHLCSSLSLFYSAAASVTSRKEKLVVLTGITFALLSLRWLFPPESLNSNQLDVIASTWSKLGVRPYAIKLRMLALSKETSFTERMLLLLGLCEDHDALWLAQGFLSKMYVLFGSVRGFPSLTHMRIANANYQVVLASRHGEIAVVKDGVLTGSYEPPEQEIRVLKGLARYERRHEMFMQMNVHVREAKEIAVKLEAWDQLTKINKEFPELDENE